MSEVHGIKETKEALVAFFAIAKFCVVRFKDGVGVNDVEALYDKIKNDPEFTALLAAAYENYKLIPVEAKDIDFKEGLELGMIGFEAVKDIVIELKK